MADRYFVGTGTQVWNNTANWSTSSGGSGGAGVPTASDNVFLDVNSPNCTLDINTAYLYQIDTATYAKILAIDSYTLKSFAIYFRATTSVTATTGTLWGTGRLNFEDFSTFSPGTSTTIVGDYTSATTTYLDITSSSSVEFYNFSTQISSTPVQSILDGNGGSTIVSYRHNLDLNGGTLNCNFYMVGSETSSTITGSYTGSAGLYGALVIQRAIAPDLTLNWNGLIPPPVVGGVTLIGRSGGLLTVNVGEAFQWSSGGSNLQYCDLTSNGYSLSLGATSIYSSVLDVSNSSVSTRAVTFYGNGNQVTGSNVTWVSDSGDIAISAMDSFSLTNSTFALTNGNLTVGSNTSSGSAKVYQNDSDWNIEGAMTVTGYGEWHGGTGSLTIDRFSDYTSGTYEAAQTWFDSSIVTIKYSFNNRRTLYFQSSSVHLKLISIFADGEASAYFCNLSDAGTSVIYFDDPGFGYDGTIQTENSFIFDTIRFQDRTTANKCWLFSSPLKFRTYLYVAGHLRDTVLPGSPITKVTYTGNVTGPNIIEFASTGGLERLILSIEGTGSSGENHIIGDFSSSLSDESILEVEATTGRWYKINTSTAFRFGAVFVKKGYLGHNVNVDLRYTTVPSYLGYSLIMTTPPSGNAHFWAFGGTSVSFAGGLYLEERTILTQLSGTIYYINNNKINVQATLSGNITTNSGSKMVLQGLVTPWLSNSGFFSIGNVEVNTPSQELVFQTDFRINNLTITDCAYVDVTTVSLYVLGNLTLTAMSGDFGGDTFLGSGSEIIFVAQNLVNPNDLIRGNANWGFNGFSHTVQLKSATLNNCSIGVGQLAAPTLECGSFASPAIVSGVFSAYTGSTCTFQTNTALSANSISINGSSPSSRVTLTSSGIWFLNVTSPTSVSYVSAKYSDASGGSTIYATDGTSLDVGFNFNWEFPSTTTTSSSTSTSTSSSTSTSTSTSSTSTSTSSTSSSTSSTSLSSSSSSSTSSTSTATASTSTSTTLTSTSTTVTTTVSDYYYIEIHKNIKSVTSFLGGKK